MTTALIRAGVGMLVLIVLPMVLAPPVSAQDVATSFEQLRALVKPGDTVYVTDASGRRTKGKLGELSAASLELLVRQTQSDGSEKWVPKARLSEGEVRQITRERHDSLWNGALIGLAVGAAPALISIAINAGGIRPIEPGAAFQIIMIPGAMGAGIGALIDALIFERWTVYVTPGHRSSRVQVLPLLSKSAAGAQMSVKF